MSKTLDSYNNSAKKYAGKFTSYEPYRRQVGRFIKLLNKNSHVLDLGCGPGQNSRAFVDAGHRVTGVDFSEAMIVLAEKFCPEADFIKSSFQEYNPKAVVDAVCLSFAIVHLNDEQTEELIKRLPGFFVDGGLVYISIMTGNGSGYETTSFSDGEIFFNYYDKEWIIDLMGRSGFSLIQSDIEPYEEQDGSVTEDVFLVFEKDL